MRERGDEAAEREDHEAGGDHRLAAELVGRPAVEDIEQRLRDAVGPERDPDEQHVVAARDGFRVDREHRHDHEQAEHAQREDRRERRGRAQFGRSHAGRRGRRIGHRE
ncbi:Uncharacterised protein [Clostridium sporogenes]|nr:Uncharacterised protein [Clostridium sporogenes]